MNEIAQNARAALLKAQQELAFATKQVERVERNCLHDWTEAIYEPVLEKSYTIPPEYRCGLLYRGEMFVPQKTKDRWVRSCKLCGRRDETTQAVEVQITNKTPRF